MASMRMTKRQITGAILAWVAWCGALFAAAGPAPSPNESARRMVARLDAPLLFVKRHSFQGLHIYDTFYKWPPGGGGIYVIENPSSPRSQWTIRPVIDATTPGTLGIGVYSHPELSWDARKLLFCFKGEPAGSTSIYEIGIDGKGLRRLTDPGPSCAGCNSPAAMLRHGTLTARTGGGDTDGCIHFAHDRR